MAFVREKISKEDFEKYRIGRFDERLPNSLFPDSSFWAIDRERDIYLATASSGGREPETYNNNKFIFYVNRDVYIVNIRVTLTKLGDKHWLQDYKQQSWNFIPYFSASSKPKRPLSEIPILFKEAIKTYRFWGADDLNTKIDFTFDF